MFSKPYDSNFSKIRPGLKTHTSISDKIKFVLVAGNCNDPKILEYLNERKSLDNAFSECSQTYLFLNLFEQSYYSINIKKSKFIKVDGRYPNCMIGELEPSIDARRICDHYFEFLKEKIHEIFKEVMPTIDNFDLEEPSELKNEIIAPTMTI